MQRLPSRGTTTRPKPLQISKSFSRSGEPHPSPLVRSRATTLQEGIAPILSSPRNTQESERENAQQGDDVFEHRAEDGAEAIAAVEAADTFPEGYDELPIEIQSLMERFLESLGAKVHPAPISIDRLAELYQDFYVIVESHISTHIATLSSRISRDISPTPSVSSFSSFVPMGRGRKSSKPENNPSDNAGPVHQMLTTSEITDKRKARRDLENKRVALEEAVERGVCERVYPRLWRYRSTDDEARDEKLRSRAAALSLVGVDLHELLSTALSHGDAINAPELHQVRDEKSDSARYKLADARTSLEQMNSDRYPFGKLKHLTAAHKGIVEVLSQIFPSTSSADEVLATLIYAIITSDPDKMHFVSNLNFISSFRASNKIDGEAAYCITNLEAAISFLENVDLSSIRPDEMPEGPAKSSSRPTTPRGEAPDPMYRGLPNEPNSSSPSSGFTDSPTQHRRQSSLRPKPFEFTTDAVRDGADAAFDTLHGALSGSFRFLFGRLKEQQASQSPEEVVVPKTLEDARKLISTPSAADDNLTVGEDSVAERHENAVEDPREQDGRDRLLELVSGRRISNSRDLSADSTKSAGSAKRVAFAEGRLPMTATASRPRANSPKASSLNATAPGPNSNNPGYAAMESMRNLGNSLNPLKTLTGMSMMRGFGRSPSASSTPTITSDAAYSAVEDVADENTTRERPVMDLSGMAPPIRRYVEMKQPKEMTFYDVELLLRDYQRLAGALYAAGGPPAA